MAQILFHSLAGLPIFMLFIIYSVQVCCHLYSLAALPIVMLYIIYSVQICCHLYSLAALPILMLFIIDSVNSASKTTIGEPTTLRRSFLNPHIITILIHVPWFLNEALKITDIRPIPKSTTHAFVLYSASLV